MLTQLEQMIQESFIRNNTLDATANDLQMERHTVASILRTISNKESGIKQIRAQIIELKDVLEKDEVEEVVVDWCIETLGISQSLAKTYFAKEWSKV